MAFWDKVKDVASDVSSEAKNVADKAKFKNLIRSQEQKINDIYKQMGEKLYNSNSTPPVGYEEHFNGIAAANREIERLKTELSKYNKN